MEILKTFHGSKRVNHMLIREEEFCDVLFFLLEFHEWHKWWSRDVQKYAYLIEKDGKS